MYVYVLCGALSLSLNTYSEQNCLHTYIHSYMYIVRSQLHPCLTNYNCNDIMIPLLKYLLHFRFILKSI